MSAQPPQPNLAWQFESSNVDSITGLAPSFSTVDGLLTSAPTYVPGKYGQAINFNNQNSVGTSNSYIQYNLNSGTANSFSVSCWIMTLDTIPVSTRNPKYIQLNSGGTSYQIQTAKSSTSSGFYSAVGSPTTIFTPNLLTTGQWGHHCFILSNVAATFPTSIVTYYFNGVSQGTTIVTPPTFSTFTSLTVGQNAWCSVDDLRLFNTALSAAQVQTIYAAGGMPNQISLSGSGTMSMQGTGTISIR
jgi:hypothetical protein